MEKIRVFISYSREDKELVEKLVAVLEDSNIDVIWDKNLVPGYGFHEQIQDSIASSHVFMPVITKESSARGWVHQEIGYAKALNIPILPVSMENLDPSGMVQMIHTIKLSNNQDEWKEYLNDKTFNNLLKNNYKNPLFLCAHLPEVRTRMIAEYTENITYWGKSGLVRQKGGLSSFHIPNKCIIESDWTDRYLPEHKSEYHKRNQLRERQALEVHAKTEGYKLILTPEYITKNDRQPIAIKARLNTIISFLEENTKNAVVAINENGDDSVHSLTIVGDWFLAESVSFRKGDGFTNTFFTRDAAEIKRRTEDFDCELKTLLKCTEEESREEAIKKLIEMRKLYESV
jgi:hypothetical protein